MKIPQNVLNLSDWLNDCEASNIFVFNTTKMDNVGDYFLVCTAKDCAQIRSICDYIEKKVEDTDFKFDEFQKEGSYLSEWVVLMFDKIFVEIFTQEEREKYNLDKLLNVGGNWISYKRLVKLRENEKKKILADEKALAKAEKEVKIKNEKIKKTKEPIKKTEKKSAKKKLKENKKQTNKNQNDKKSVKTVAKGENER